MIGQLMQSVREYRKESLLAPFFVTLEVILEVVLPILMASMIDEGINAQNMPHLWKMGVLLIVVGLVALIFGVLSGRYAAVASAGFARNLRKDIFYRVQNFSHANIDTLSTASIVTRLTTDVTNIQNAYQMSIRVAVRAPVMLVFSLISAFGLNASLSWVFFCTIPILGIGLYLIIKNAHPIFRRVFRTYDKMNRVVQENLRGIRVVKSFVREDHEIKKFSDVSQSIYTDFLKAERLLACNMPLMQFAMYGSTLLIAWFGARLIVSGSMTTGQLAGFLTYVMQILMSLMMLSMIVVMLTISRASGARIAEVLSTEPDLTNPQQPITTVENGSITFQDVSFSYSKEAQKPALSNATLSICPGERVGIIGGTGSAKTTLVQLIPRLYDVTEGSVLVGGIDVRRYDIEALRQAVAMVPQKNVLFSGTIKENLRWGNPDATDEELVRVCRLAQADGFIQSFPDGYDTYIEQGGSNVSGGQRQRLCIARALLKQPKILILDDSTSAVDTKTDAELRRALREEIPQTTQIIIAQRISSVEDADKIIVMDGGMVVAIGTHETLLQTNAIYQEVAASQSKGGDSHEA